MILNLLIIIVIGLVAYWHYIQGFFSAGLSAVIALISAVVALAFHEQVVQMFNQGKFNSQAHALVLVCLFSGVYLVLRVLFDKLVPGNVQFPVALDKAGAAACGVVAGLCGGGVIAIAGQALPFGTSSLAHHRWDIVEDTATARVSGRSQMQDGKFEALRDPDKFINNEDANNLWSRADLFVEGLIAKVSSDEGSLSTGRPWRSVHPDLLQELFGQRLGRQLGSRATALAGEDKTQVNAAFVADVFPQKDPETFQVGTDDIGVRGAARREAALKKVKDPRRPASESNTLLVLRVTVHRDDEDDKTNAVAFGPANVRLVAPDSSEEGKAKNYYPIGTLHAGSELYVAYPDDWLFVDRDKAVDLVFEVNKKDVFQVSGGGGDDAKPAAAARGPELKFRDEVFFEFKRGARINLSDIKVQPAARIRSDPSFSEVSVRRKGDEQQGVNQGGDQPPPPTPTASGATLAPEGSAQVTNRMPAPIGVDDASATVKDALRQWGGSYDLDRGRVTRLKIDVSSSKQVIAQGNATVTEFGAPDGQRLVQITARPAGDDKWAWAGELNKYQLSTAAGVKIQPAGFWADTQNAQGVVYPAARYNVRDALEGATAEYTPTNVFLLFLVPANTDVKALEYNGQLLQAVELSVK